MEEKVFKYPSDDPTFLGLLQQAEEGDNIALEYLLLAFEKEIHKLAKFIKMSHEDAVQSIRTEFISIIRSRIIKP